MRVPLEAHGLGDMGGDEAVVAGDDLDADAKAVKVGKRLRDLGLDGVEKQ